MPVLRIHFNNLTTNAILFKPDNASKFFIKVIKKVNPYEFLSLVTMNKIIMNTYSLLKF